MLDPSPSKAVGEGCSVMVHGMVGGSGRVSTGVLTGVSVVFPGVTDGAHTDGAHTDGAHTDGAHRAVLDGVGGTGACATVSFRDLV